VVKDELKQEIKRNQELFASSLNLQPTDTALFVNGMFFDLDVVDVISLLEVVRQELRVMEGLHKIGGCFASGCSMPDNTNICNCIVFVMQDHELCLPKRTSCSSLAPVC
jgi:hypothetical protein